MKNRIFATLILILSLNANAQQERPHAILSQLKKMEAARVVETKILSNGLKVNIRETVDGYRFKQVSKPENTEYISSRKRTTKAIAVSHKSEQKETTRWRESFEDWDGTDASWLPDGWTRHYNDETYLTTGRTWFLNKQTSAYVPAPVDGQYYEEILFNSKATQNEWLDTPELEPRNGEFFTMYFIAQPFGLFDMTKYDSSTKDFTERIQMWDFQVYMSVDNGSWERIYSFWEEFKDSDAYEMRMEQSYDGPRTIKIAKDLSSYAGHKVKFRMRYTGQDGDSMFFDLLELGKPYVTANYYEPSRTCNFGMTQDYQTPVNWAYYPDSIPLTWTNASSNDATDFLWTFADPNTGQTTTCTDHNITLNYIHQPETMNNLNASVFESPKLTAMRDGYESDTFISETDHFKVGGKTYVNVEGKTYHCGAGTYTYDQGMTVLTDDYGYPICGYEEGATSNYWYDVNGVSSNDYDIKVIGLYNTFSTPQKAYKLRGLWIQGIGQIERKNNLTVTIHTLDEEGVINETPMATAYLDYDSIQTYGSAKADIGKDYPYITLPFLFADPVTIDRFILVRFNGISDDGVTYFAPIQSMIPDENESCHGYLRMTSEPVTGGTKNTGLTSLSDIYGPLGYCYASLYMTLDMAYGDCDDWGHLDNVRGGNSMLKLENGHIQKYEPTSTDGLYDRTVKAAFYDKATSFNTTLYICVGALEQGDEPTLTNHIRVQMPSLSFGKEVNLSTDPVTTVSFYNCMNSTYYTATEGTLKVSKSPTGYNVTCDCYDENDDMYFGTIYEDMPWMDANIKKIIPNDLKVYYVADSIHNETDDYEQYAINSAFVNDTNKDQYIIYLATQEGIDSEEEMLALKGEPAMIIKLPASCLNNYYWGYSALYNEHEAEATKVSITFRGVEYTPENVFGVTQTGTADPLAKGGTIYGSYDFDTQTLNDFEFFVSTATDLNGRCVKAHYNGYTWSTTGIKNIDINKANNPCYNISGQRVNDDYQGIVISNNKKILHLR